MPDIFFDSPGQINGTARDQTAQLYQYLYYLSNRLNEAMNAITIEQLAPDVQEKIQVSGSNAQKAAEENDRKVYSSLKNIVIKTSEIIQNEMESLETELGANYKALSDQFGEYSRNLTSNIKATAEGILQDYQYEERVQSLEKDGENTNVFIRRSNQYIFTGLIDEVNMKYGLAIGENVTSYDTNGNPYLNHNNKMATFTMDRLSFYQGGVELAYFGNNAFYINKGIINQELQMGNHLWKVLDDGSIALTKA